jgi:2-polyprenyl-6-hydroxyphenyl methylase/3-demethylubiquinone-9 3-methyltransferase
MSRWRDIVDWVGGYPYQFAPADRLVEFVTAEGFSAVTVVPSDGPGNHQIVFRRRA